MKAVARTTGRSNSETELSMSMNPLPFPLSGMPGEAFFQACLGLKRAWAGKRQPSRRNQEW